MRKVLVLAVVAAVFLPAALFAGGQTEDEGTLGVASGRQYTMISIPKLRVAWFNRLETGLERAAADFGVNAYQQAPAAADEAQQVRIIEDAISQGVNAILVVPNDASSVVPAFARAREQNIVIGTHESPDQQNADFNVEMIDNVRFGEHAVEQLVQNIGESGEYVVYVGSLTVPAHNIWADAAIAYAEENYPDLRLVADRFPVSEDRNAARQTTLELLTTYPDLKGVLAFGSQGAPGAAQALRERGLSEQVGVIGTTSPQEAAPFLSDGSMDTSVLWDPGEAGYAMVYLAKLILDGNGDQIVDGMEIPTLGQATVEGNNVLFDRPLTVTADNADEYDF